MDSSDARANPFKYVDPDGRDIRLAGSNSAAVLPFLVRTAQHLGGRADLTSLANNHNIMVTYYDQQINTPQQVALIKANGGHVTLATTTPDKIINAKNVAVGIDTNAVPALHPDSLGVTTAAHENKHATDVGNNVSWSQIVATDTSGSAEAYGASISASPTDMTYQQAADYVASILTLPEEPPQTLTDVQRDVPP